MKNFTLTILAMLIFIACSQKSTVLNNQITFDEYVKTLNQIPLPLNHSSHEEQFSVISKTYDSTGFKNYKHVWTSIPLGKLYESDSVVVLVDLSYGDYGQVPFITSFDRKGNKIDSLGPFKKTGTDIGYYAIEFLTINKDWTIMVTDTLKEWKLNADETDIIPDSLTITIDTTIYKIGKLGKIIKTK